LRRASEGIIKPASTQSKAKYQRFQTAEHALNYVREQLEVGASGERLEYVLNQALNSPLRGSDSRLGDLLLNVDIPNGRSLKVVRRVQRQLLTELEDDLKATPNREWEHAELFAGKRIELVGGDIVHRVLDRLRANIPQAEINWNPTHLKGGDLGMKSLERSARSGAIDIILLITSFIGHRVSTRFYKLNRREFVAGKVLRVQYVDRGYGLSKIKSHLLCCIDDEV
jgi:hypothetical protein